jgi:hypothetical protein
MAFIKNQYPTRVSLTPYYVWIKANAVDGIIIDDVPPAMQIQNRAVLKSDPVWLAIENDYMITVLSSEPKNLINWGRHEDLDTTHLKIKGNELFILGQKTGAPDDEGYQFGALDKIYVKLDIKANTIEVFKG